jgi:phage terminase small subunit
MAKLKPEHQRFAEEYVYDWNATRAYQSVYPDTGYDAARSSASTLLTNPNIKAYVEELQKDIQKQAGISRLMVLKEHQKLAFSSIAHLHNTWIERKDFDQLSESEKACIAEISTQTRKVPLGKDGDEEVEIEFVKVKLFDKQKALDSISKMLGYDAPTKNINMNYDRKSISELFPEDEDLVNG